MHVTTTTVKISEILIYWYYVSEIAQSRTQKEKTQKDGTTKQKNDAHKSKIKKQTQRL